MQEKQFKVKESSVNPIKQKSDKTDSFEASYLT